MKISQKTIRDSLVIGLALFSMFFGAGNLIFPPKLGLECGDRWGTGFLFYFMIDIGLGILAVFSMIRKNPARYEALITHRLPLEKGQEAMEMLARGEAFKIMIEP